jgi:O-antigen/teichoic acid export membrane protein
VTGLGDERGRTPDSSPSHILDPSGRRLARGTLTVAAGLAVTGTGTLAMIALVDYALGKNPASAFNLWWLTTTLLSTVFGVFEAYLSRLAVTENAAGRDPSPVVSALLGRTWLVAGGMSIVVLAMGPWLTSREFGGYAGLTLLLPVFVFIAATQAVQRAVATGRGQFSAIAAQLATDGILRIGITVILVTTGWATADNLAIGTCVAGAGGIAAGGLKCPGWFARPHLRAAGVSWQPILLLLAGSACPLLASTGPALWLNAAGNVSQPTIVAFSAALTISRIPTQFVSAAFSPLLSQLGHAIEQADHATFVRLRGKAEVAAVGLGALFIVVFAVGGAWALPIYSSTPSGSAIQIGNLALLACAGALMFLAVVQQASLAALDEWGWIARSWGGGTVALVLAFFLPLAPVTRAVLAPVAAVLVATVLMFLARGSSRERLAKAGPASVPAAPPAG